MRDCRQLSASSESGSCGRGTAAVHRLPGLKREKRLPALIRVFPSTPDRASAFWPLQLSVRTREAEGQRTH